MQSCVLEEHDGLAVADFASPNLLKGLVQRKLQHLDVLALVGVAPTANKATTIGGNAVSFDRAGAGTGLVHQAT